MSREPSRPILTAVFVDYDNVYLSLKRKSEDAAKRFAKDAGGWLQAIASGALVTPTNSIMEEGNRRLVMNRCYGNPVPRRNASDNSTDMNSFAFVRHHFLRSGFEIIDCPPLTAQLKNSSDIRMVMDIRDFLDHHTNFDEFIIMSSDADFTPVLHRLRSYAKRTAIFANDNTVGPYTALSDGEVRETDLIAFLLNERGQDSERASAAEKVSTGPLREQIIEQVVQAVLESDRPMPLEALADRAIRAIGHDKTVGTNWAGANSFRDLLIAGLPETIKLTGEPPFVAYDATRVVASRSGQSDAMVRETTDDQQRSRAEAGSDSGAATVGFAGLAAGRTASSSSGPNHANSENPATRVSVPARSNAPTRSNVPARASAPALASAPAARASTAETIEATRPNAIAHPNPAPHANSVTPQHESAAGAEVQHSGGRDDEPDSIPNLQKSIARIHQSCKAPPFSPPEYRVLFGVLEDEIKENRLQGVSTVENFSRRAAEVGISVSLDDARYVIEAVSQTDPWLEHGGTAAAFAERFRNYVIAKCRQQGLELSLAELELIDAWFAGPAQPDTQQVMSMSEQSDDHGMAHAEEDDPNWWHAPMTASNYPQLTAQDVPSSQQAAGIPHFGVPAAVSEHTAVPHGDEFPRIVRNRFRG
ncbi:MAG: NYN domain-containing protein [Hyphomicrobiaceae bacterium]